MMENGELKDHDFVKYKIAGFGESDEQALKDNLVTNRRRSIILTNLKYIEREYTKRKVKIQQLEQKQAKAAERKQKLANTPKKAAKSTK